MRWLWDEDKNRANRRRHRVSFETAQLVFDDPLAITVPDPFPDEERWRTVGSPHLAAGVVLFVVHTWPEPDQSGEAGGRIISARKATKNERRAYEEGSF